MLAVSPQYIWHIPLTTTKKKKKFKYKIKNKKHKMPKEDSLVPRLKMATTIHKENQLHFLTA